MLPRALRLAPAGSERPLPRRSGTGTRAPAPAWGASGWTVLLPRGMQNSAFSLLARRPHRSLTPLTPSSASSSPQRFRAAPRSWRWHAQSTRHRSLRRRASAQHRQQSAPPTRSPWALAVGQPCFCSRSPHRPSVLRCELPCT